MMDDVDSIMEDGGEFMFIVFIVGLALLALFIQLIYVRYAPVKGIPCIENTKKCDMEIVTLDIRDYQQASNDVIDGAIVIPVPYLRRYHNEIPSSKLHIVATDHLEKNIAIRFLQNKGYEIVGYTLTNCKCKKKLEHFA